MKKITFCLVKNKEKKCVGIKLAIIVSVFLLGIYVMYSRILEAEYKVQLSKESIDKNGMNEEIVVNKSDRNDDLLQQEYYQLLSQAFDTINDFSDIPIIGHSNVTDTELEIRDIIEKFSEAYFTGDIQGQKKFICEDAENDVNEINYTENGVIVIGIKGLVEGDDLIKNQEKNIQLEFCFSGEESLTYLSMQFIKETEEWKIKSFGLEK